MNAAPPPAAQTIRKPADYDAARDGVRLFGFDAGAVYPCHPLGTLWNGFDNVEVSPPVLSFIVEDLRAFGSQFPDDCGELDEMAALGVEENGRVSLAYGYASQLVEPEPRDSRFTYRSEFPEYPPATLPPIPSHWRDTSWHNDACPSFQVSPALAVFVDYADKALSDFANVPDRARFHLCRLDGDGMPLASDNGPHLPSLNDWDETLRAVFWDTASRPIATRQEGEQFVRDMHAAALSYHLEDSPSDIYVTATGAPLFTAEQAELVGERVAETYAAWGGGRDDCPIGLLLELMREAGELPADAVDPHPPAVEEGERFPLSDWQYEVANGDTRLGYADWLAVKEESDDGQ